MGTEREKYVKGSEEDIRREMKSCAEAGSEHKRKGKGQEQRGLGAYHKGMLLYNIYRNLITSSRESPN